MNVNEVLATLASANGSASPCTPTTTSTPRSRRTTCSPARSGSRPAQQIVRRLIPALESLEAELRRLAKEHATTVKAGRTHLMDAVPITFGDEVGGWARTVRLGIERLVGMLPRLGELPLGGTAVGSGLNAPRGFAADVVAKLAGRPPAARRPRPPTTSRPSRRRTRSSRRAARSRSSRSALYKIAGDLRLLGSGPATGLARARAARAAGGLVDHAGQGQPGGPGSRCSRSPPRWSATTPPSPLRRRSRRSSSTPRCR